MNLRQVKTKIRSIGNVKKITRALQMVSAIKMKKAQAEEISSRPYRLTLEEVIKKIIKRIDEESSPLLHSQNEDSQKELIIFISSNKGLCGSFHVNLDRYLLRNIKFEETDFIAVGKKGAVFASRMGSKVIADFSGNNPLIEVTAVFKLALDQFYGGHYKKISLVYNRFISTLKSETVQETILPFKVEEQTNKDKPVANLSREYLIEPSPQEIIDYLLKNFLEEKIRGAIISSQAVEHSARMIAMKNATDNANDITYNLTLLSNKIRQNKITSELLDMVTAKESVEN
jgi:F-type H+-transporting ATPase subunit gamma